MNRWPWLWKRRSNQEQGGATPTPPANVPLNAPGGVSSPSNGQGATTPLPTPRSGFLGHPSAKQGVSSGNRLSSKMATCTTCGSVMRQNLVNLQWQCQLCQQRSLAAQMQGIGMGQNPYANAAFGNLGNTCPRCGFPMMNNFCTNSTCTYVVPVQFNQPSFQVHKGTSGIKAPPWSVKSDGTIVDSKGRTPISPEQRDALDAWLMRNTDAMRRLGIELPPSWDEEEDEPQE